MARRGTFRARLDLLARRVGEGTLTGLYDVNQRYAAYQHVHQGLHHPRGGGPNYVSAPLRAGYRRWYRAIADALLSGGAPRAMAAALEELDRAVTTAAPVDLNNLRQSGTVRVLDNGRPVYVRPARIARLPERPRRGR